MPEELETILRLVAEGKLTPEDAAPIIDALTQADRSERRHERGDRIGRRIERARRRMGRVHGVMDEAFAHAEERFADAAERFPDAAERIGAPRGRHLRIRVTERGRQVVNLRIPIGFVDAALQFVPGLAGDQGQRIRDAVEAGATGPILDVEDPDGGGVLISVE